MGTDAAATFLGHSSTVITEGHYIEPDRTVDPRPAAILERTLRPDRPDDALLSLPSSAGEEEALAVLDVDPELPLEISGASDATARPKVAARLDS